MNLKQQALWVNSSAEEPRVPTLGQGLLLCLGAICWWPTRVWRTLRRLGRRPIPTAAPLVFQPFDWSALARDLSALTPVRSALRDSIPRHLPPGNVVHFRPIDGRGFAVPEPAKE